MSTSMEILLFLLGVVLGTLLGIVIEELLGPRLRVTVGRARRKFGRFLRDEPIKARLLLRFDADKRLDEHEADRKQASALRSAGLTDYQQQADMVIGTGQQGHTKYVYRMYTMYFEEEEEASEPSSLAEAFKFELEYQLFYRRFHDIMADVNAVVERATAAFAREGLHADLDSRSFAIDISSLPELGGFFSILQTASFEANIGEGQARLLYGDRSLEFRGPLDSATLSVVRDAILFGF